MGGPQWEAPNEKGPQWEGLRILTGGALWMFLFPPVHLFAQSSPQGTFAISYHQPVRPHAFHKVTDSTHHTVLLYISDEVVIAHTLSLSTHLKDQQPVYLALTVL